MLGFLAPVCRLAFLCARPHQATRPQPDPTPHLRRPYKPQGGPWTLPSSRRLRPPPLLALRAPLLLHLKLSVALASPPPRTGSTPAAHSRAPPPPRYSLAASSFLSFFFWPRAPW